MGKFIRAKWRPKVSLNNNAKVLLKYYQLCLYTRYFLIGRSLVALSLILASLQFKPAPMYILDEVDAALELSHTKNVSQLLRNQFKGSQLIVVSLKDGMFNNANVLFRTRFPKSSSVVEVIFIVLIILDITYGLYITLFFFH